MRSGGRALAVAAALLAPALPLAAAPGDAAAPFACPLAQSWMSCGFVAQTRSAERITPVEIAGVSGVRLETRPGDSGIAGSGRAERTDLSLPVEVTGCAQGEEQWWTHSLLFPDDYAAPAASAADPWPWGVVFDFHQTGSEGQANFEVEVVGEPPQLKMAISGGAVVSNGAPGSPTRRWQIGPLIRNHWYRFRYHVRWSSGADGFFDAWVDGRSVLAYRGATLYAGQGCYLKLANYHTPVGGPVAVVHADLRRAATEAALAPSP
jgi:hypothetical protein